MGEIDWSNGALITVLATAGASLLNAFYHKGIPAIAQLLKIKNQNDVLQADLRAKGYEAFIIDLRQHVNDLKSELKQDRDDCNREIATVRNELVEVREQLTDCLVDRQALRTELDLLKTKMG